MPAKPKDPIDVKRRSRAFGDRPARRKQAELTVRVDSLSLGRGENAEAIRGDGQIDIFVTGRVGEHRFGPSTKVVIVPALKPGAKGDAAPESRAYCPPHLSRASVPAKLARSLQRASFVPSLRPRKDRSAPTTIYNPDTRYVFSDTRYPWSTCGRVDTAGAFGSGVMVGPRHLLTASHVVRWGQGGTAGWLKFTPSSFDGSAPFGMAWAETIYSWVRADGSDGLDPIEGAFDYVVCVLDRRLGETTGWMGSRGYFQNWNGSPYWSHVGYPSDIAGGKRPVFLDKGVMDSGDVVATGGRTSLRLHHRNDIYPGQSGGPFFGWWEGEVGPHTVATQSGEKLGGPDGVNTAGGASPLPELVRYALNAKP